MTYMAVSDKRKTQKLTDCKIILSSIYDSIGYERFFDIIKKTTLPIQQGGTSENDYEEIYIGRILFELSGDKQKIIIHLPKSPIAEN